MSIRLSEIAHGRNNNFNLIRFVAAGMVVLTHAFALSPGQGAENDPLNRLVGMSFGDVGVDIFFVTSGFLVANSFFTGKTWAEFVWARVLRIYPALIVAALFCVTLGAYFTTLDFLDYATAWRTWRFFVMNSLVWFGEQSGLPGVFESTPFGGWVNGPLWTLPHEVHLYALLALLGAVFIALGGGLRLPVIRIGMLFMAVLLLLFVGVNYEYSVFPKSYVSVGRLYAMFFSGVTAYVWRDKVRLSLWVAWSMLGILVIVFLFFSGELQIIYGIFLPYLVLCAAYLTGGFLLYFNRIGDYSYGVYIYHWPIMQSIVSLFPGVTVWVMFLSGSALTLVVAITSWNFLEKKCLKLKKFAQRSTSEHRTES